MPAAKKPAAKKPAAKKPAAKKATPATKGVVARVAQAVADGNDYDAKPGKAKVSKAVLEAVEHDVAVYLAAAVYGDAAARRVKEQA